MIHSRGRGPAAPHFRISLGLGRGFIAGCVLVGCVLGLPGQTDAQQMKSATVEHCKKATVEVFTAMTKSVKGDTPMGSGSGYFINRTGLLITNNHVVDPTHRKSQRQKQAFHYNAGRLVWTVITDAGTEDEKQWECMVVYQNEWADQAILQAYVGRPEDEEKLDSPHFLYILPESRLKERMKIWTLGFPGGDNRSTTKGEHPEVSITTGQILEIARTPAGRISLIYVDSLARPGNSGGPCVTIDGFLVGTLTIMASPEGRGDTGGNTGAGLVPSPLTARFVRNAYELGKMPPGSDPTPFMRALTNSDGRIDIPEYPRRNDDDILHYPNGDRIYGKIMTDKINWNSPLGEVEVPTDAIAYVMSDDTGAKLYLEGGNLILASEVGSTFQFKPKGGEEVEQHFDDLKLVCFRKADRRLEPVLGDVLIFETDAANLTLSDAESKTKFQSQAGLLEFKIGEITAIDIRDADDMQIITLVDGQRFTGNFVDEPFTATIAATGTPVRFSLAKVRHGVIESVYEGVSDVAGINLMALMGPADRDIRKIARKLETDDVKEAWRRLNKLRDSKKYRGFSNLKKEQIALLQAVAHLREGKYSEALSAFRKAARGEDLNVSSFANAFLAVLKRYNTNEYEGQPLNDRATFADAGIKLSDGTLGRVQNLLRDYREVDPEKLKKGEYRRRISDVKKYEKELRVASVLSGLDADHELIRLWKFACDMCRAEQSRLKMAMEEERQKAQERSSKGSRRAGSRGSRGGGAQVALQRTLDKMKKQIEEADEVWYEYRYKLYKSGFRIQDPDIDRERDRNRSDETDDEDEDDGEEP